MKKLLIGVVALFGILLLVAVIAGFMQPSTIELTRTTITRAAPGDIYPLVADLEKWSSWTVWNLERDPTATWSYEGSAGEKGQTSRWEGDELGKGRMVLTHVEANAKVEYDLYFDDSADASKGSIVLMPKGEGTQIAWSARMDFGSNPLMRLMGGAIETAIGTDFDLGLATLKTRAEAAAADEKGEETASAD